MMNMSWEKTAIAAYLVDLITNERLEFQYNPENISDSKTTDYATIKIPGLSHPRYQYVSGGARQINFKISLFMKDVKKTVEWIQALQYPTHEGTMLKNAPHRVLLVVGDLYPGLECVVKQVKATYFGLFDPASLLPQQADVDLSLEEFVSASVSFGSIRK
jgi:hypothetical protein